MRRIVSVWLIDWPVTAWSLTAGRSPPPEHQPFALIERGPRGLALRALNRAARARGLRMGQSHADARAICPSLVSHPVEPEREAALLGDLVRWCERWTPLVAEDRWAPGFEGLFLDVTGADHLFGGELEMLRDMARCLKAVGICARLGLAETPGAAWAVARYGQPTQIETCRIDRAIGRRGAMIVPAGGVREAIDTLPIAALRIDEATLGLARRFGLNRIESLHAMPRAGLARRFRGGDAIGLVRRLDQALGIEPETLAWRRAPSRYRTVRRFAAPLLDMAGIDAHLGLLARALAPLLEADAMGARALTLSAYRCDGRTPALEICLGTPTRDIAIWQRLFREAGLDRIDPGFGVDALALEAGWTEPVDAAQMRLDGDEEAVRRKLSEAIDRLAARLGSEAVLAPNPRASWLPERASRWTAARGGEVKPLAGGNRARPLLLIDPPEPIEAVFELPEGAPRQFSWRRVLRRVNRAEGPERIAPEWWRLSRRATRTRDYYRVEDDCGARYWLFREGLFGREDGDRAPSWWLHGLFP